jgi:prepilin-type N-terminal cleavage/methylation domain-containing protein
MSTPRAPRRRKAFTLIEILVVLAIAAIITGITVGGFKEMSAGNKRVSCQSNLAQIYQSCRMYASDEGGKFPLFATISAGAPQPAACPVTSTSNKGSGLWSLYTFPNNSFNGPDESRPIERYVRSAKVLHCPDHITHMGLFNSGTSLYDPEYLSYQSCDGSVPTYSSVRTTVTTDADWKKQLMNYNVTNLVARPPDANTIVTWCVYHRGSRGMDNVLFYDGSVQLMPQNYSGKTDWHRDPKPPQ